VVELDIGVDFGLQAARSVARCRSGSNTGRYSHRHPSRSFFQRVQAIGVVAFGGEISERAITLRKRLAVGSSDSLFEQFLRRVHPAQGCSLSWAADAFVITRPATMMSGTALAGKRLDGRRAVFLAPLFAAHARLTFVEQLAVELHLPRHPSGMVWQAEMRDQFAQADRGRSIE